MDTRWRQAQHVVFAGALPLTDIGTDLLVINGIFANNTADSGAHSYEQVAGKPLQPAGSSRF